MWSDENFKKGALNLKVTYNEWTWKVLEKGIKISLAWIKLKESMIDERVSKRTRKALQKRSETARQGNPSKHLALPMLRLVSSKAQERKDFRKSSKPCPGFEPARWWESKQSVEPPFMQDIVKKTIMRMQNLAKHAGQKEKKKKLFDNTFKFVTKKNLSTTLLGFR